MTTTIETGFGSRLMVGGFLLNNELTDFSFQPQRNDRLVANRVQGGKRPRSSMAPTIVFDQMGQPVISIGSPGGSRIINYVAQAVIGLIDWELNPQQAASQPHVVNRNGTTEIESSETAAALSGVLRGLGHDTKIRTLESGLNIIKRRKNGMLEGGTDPRSNRGWINPFEYTQLSRQKRLSSDCQQSLRDKHSHQSDSFPAALWDW